MKQYPKTLTIAGSDSGGGAGIQADLKTFFALGTYGMSAITALTAQNTTEVRSIWEVSASFVATQIDCIFEDIGVDAVKIGMLQNQEIIEAVGDRLIYHQGQVVLDPVMVAKSGALLLSPDCLPSLKKILFPLSLLVTPNIPEAELLTGSSIQTQVQMEQAAQKILSMGPQAVLIKGGHLRNELCADFVCGHGIEKGRWFPSIRIQTKNTHGTGCTLSAAITAFLAKGASTIEAILYAKAYLQSAILSGAKYTLGRGHGPVDHQAKWVKPKNISSD